MKTKTRKPKQDRRVKWDDRFYVLAYQLASEGIPERQIAASCQMTSATFSRYKQTKPALRQALARGKERAKGIMTELTDYVYGMLPDDLQSLYDEISQFHQEKAPARKIETLLRKGGKRARQYLFLQAFMTSNFNPSAACRFVNISLDEFQEWTANEPEFGRLMNQMVSHKKNLFESALIELVRKGDSSAIIFANKTINRDRGYNEKVEIEVQGEIEHHHSHTVVPIDALDLPIETRRELLAAIRKRKPKTIEVKASNEKEK